MSLDSDFTFFPTIHLTKCNDSHLPNLPRGFADLPAPNNPVTWSRGLSVSQHLPNDCSGRFSFLLLTDKKVQGSGALSPSHSHLLQMKFFFKISHAFNVQHYFGLVDSGAPHFDSSSFFHPPINFPKSTENVISNAGGITVFWKFALNSCHGNNNWLYEAGGFPRFPAAISGPSFRSLFPSVFF